MGAPAIDNLPQAFPDYEPPAVVPDDWQFRYKHYDEAPPSHRRVMILALYQLSPEEVAHKLGARVGWVQDVMSHPPNQAMIDQVRFKRDVMLQHAGQSMSEIVQKGVEYCRGVIEDSSAPHHQKMDVLKWASDHDPSGNFSPRKKIESTHSHHFHSEGAINSLLEAASAAQLECQKDRERAITVKARQIPQEVGELE